jgi:hypothetical protein
MGSVTADRKAALGEDFEQAVGQIGLGLVDLVDQQYMALGCGLGGKAAAAPVAQRTAPPEGPPQGAGPQ